MKKIRQFRSRQGRTDRQQSDSLKITFASFLGFAICVLTSLIIKML